MDKGEGALLDLAQSHQGSELQFSFCGLKGMALAPILRWSYRECPTSQWPVQLTQPFRFY